MAPQNRSNAFAAAPTTVRNFGNWGVYAAAAGATLAMASNADAGIIYGTINKTVSVPTTGTGNSQKALGFFSVANSASLRIHRTSHNSSGTARLNLIDFHLLRNGTATVIGQTTARKFALNSVIGASANNHGHGGTMLFRRDMTSAIGQFGGTQTGFAGFKDNAGQFGWLRIATSSAGSTGYVNAFTVIDYAYQSVAGQSILAGEGIPTGTPEPSTAALGLLAAGAAGIAAWRRRRNEVAAK